MKEYEATVTILWKELIKGSFSYKGAEYYKKWNHDTFKRRLERRYGSTRTPRLTSSA